MTKNDDREYWLNVAIKSAEKGIDIAMALEREACARIAGIALLGADKALADRVVNAIRARGQS